MCYTTVILRRLCFAVFVNIGLLFAVSCEEEAERPVGNSKIILTETTVDHVAYNWADLKGLITCNIPTFDRYDDHGFCWDTATCPDKYRSVKSLGEMAELGTYSARIEGLENNTRYYLRSYAELNGRIVYGPVNEFTTTGCGTDMRIVHTAGEVAPVTKTVNYGTIETDITGSKKCWITQNLGADRQATAASDTSEASAGWYWQFNQKQGFKHDGIIRTPNTKWLTFINENSDWQSVNDPCAILLGIGWRLPTKTEWEAADASQGWENYNETFSSVLKLHTAGCLSSIAGLLSNQESVGWYWSNSQFSEDYGHYLLIYNNSSLVLYNSKAYGFSVRCLSD